MHKSQAVAPLKGIVSFCKSTLIRKIRRCFGEEYLDMPQRLVRRKRRLRIASQFVVI